MAAVSNQSALIIPPSSAADTNELRALKPPVKVPGDWGWIWWTLLAVALLAVAYWAWRRWRKPPIAAPIPPVLPHVLARQRLQAALAFIQDPKRFCTSVSDALRTYLEDRFQFHAPERTTEEFMTELHGTHLLTLDQRESLSAFLQSCDLVKFARHEPTEAALRDLHECALRLVDETQFERVRVDGASALVSS